VAEIRANNVPDEFVTRFDIERAKRGRMSVREAVMEAIELWISSGGHTAIAMQSEQKHRHEHEILDLLLSGDPEMAERIRGVLDTFARAVANTRKGSKQTKVG